MVSTYRNDYYNNNKRNTRNTHLCDYNCGGYALGTFNWYLPYENYDYSAQSLYFGKGMAPDEMVDFYAKFMLKDFFGKLRQINSIKEKTSDEKVIAFRCCKYDFHFCVRGDNGVWYHKPGTHTIRRIKKKEVFADEWISPDGEVIYDSKIILFAMKKS